MIWKMTISGKSIAKVLGGFLRWKTGRHVPLFATYNVSGRCNLKCVFCDWWKLNVPELSTRQALTAIDEVCGLGVPFFHFSGGEPMLRQDLLLLAQRAASYGCRVGMSTNGTLFNSFNVARVANAFDMISVSLDGPRDVHDRYRGVDGTFDKAVEAIRLLKREGVKVGVNTIVAPWNIELVPEFIEWLYGYVDFAMLQPIHPYPPTAENTPSPTAVLDLVHFLLKFKHTHPRFLAVPVDFIKGFKMFFDGKCPKLCHAGELFIALDPTGRLLACAARPDIVLGNVLERPVGDILDSRVRNGDWHKVSECNGCWLGCTAQASMAIQKPLQEAISLSGTVI